MKISKKAQYGLRAMIFLAREKGKVFSLKEISEKEKIPFDFLEKIILKLKKAGLLKAKKGSIGGYYLAKSPEKIKVGKIIEILEGKPRLVKCLEGICQISKNCRAKVFWKKLQRSINSVLNSVTLKDLIK